MEMIKLPTVYLSLSNSRWKRIEKLAYYALVYQREFWLSNQISLSIRVELQCNAVTYYPIDNPCISMQFNVNSCWDALLNSQSKRFNTFTAKHLKKSIPQCQACFKDSWILRVYGFNTEYLQIHSTYHCETYTECGLYIKRLFESIIKKIVTWLLAAKLKAILK